MKHAHWFRWISALFLFIFFGLMILTTGVAFTRRSGSTGLDMGTVQKIRYDALPKPSVHIVP